MVAFQLVEDVDSGSVMRRSSALPTALRVTMVAAIERAARERLLLVEGIAIPINE